MIAVHRRYRIRRSLVRCSLDTVIMVIASLLFGVSGGAVAYALTASTEVVNHAAAAAPVVVHGCKDAPRIGSRVTSIGGDPRIDFPLIATPSPAGWTCLIDTASQSTTEVEVPGTQLVLVGVPASAAQGAVDSYLQNTDVAATSSCESVVASRPGWSGSVIDAGWAVICYPAGNVSWAGLHFAGSQIITINADQSDKQIAATVAHESAHAIDAEYLTPELRAWIETTTTGRGSTTKTADDMWLDGESGSNAAYSASFIESWAQTAAVCQGYDRSDGYRVLDCALWNRVIAHINTVRTAAGESPIPTPQRRT